MTPWASISADDLHALRLYIIQIIWPLNMRPSRKSYSVVFQSRCPSGVSQIHDCYLFIGVISLHTGHKTKPLLTCNQCKVVLTFFLSWAVTSIL